MADEQYRWLDRETAERLLRGESLEAVDAADRDQAERLAKTLEALTVEPPLSSGAELPGEAAALAAFRAARADRDDVAMTVGHRSGSHASRAGDVGLVRIGAPDCTARRRRWGRPVRLGLAAALAVGMVGGVAVAAGTGVLKTPFGGDEPGRPAATVSAAVPPERPLISPSPDIGAQDEPTPRGTSKDHPGPGAPKDTAPGGPAGDRETAGADRDGQSGGWRQAVTACRDMRDGKQLSRDRRRALESAAGSSARVWKYCTGLLTGAGESTQAQPDKAKGDTDEQGGKGDGGKGDDEDRPNGSGGHGHGNGNGGGNGHRTNGAAAKSPSPSYSAL
ncbi:hypothetical protein ACQEV2_26615 [Streptomyces sp. CA-251387]|uniref:hypothetical protein n=1 Tax=Streptomyces sp. CA-251387 TaxID=3240064 RepID=UPI003D912C1D